MMRPWPVPTRGPSGLLPTRRAHYPRAGKLLGVWDVRDTLHLAFQIRLSHDCCKSKSAPFCSFDRWTEAAGVPMFLRYRPHYRCKTPEEIFVTNPAAVLVAAQSSFAPDDTNW